MTPSKNLSTYLRQFSGLRTDRSANWSAATGHQAPHKPFLLLAVLDLFAQGKITTNLIQVDAELGELFAGYWSRVMPRERRGNLALPFFHLRSSSFWHLIPVPGQEAVLKAIRQVDTLSHLQRLALGAQLDEELFMLLSSEADREALRAVLLETYFAPEVRLALLEQGETNLAAYLYSRRLVEAGRIKELPEDEETYQAEVRDQGFRRAVVGLYEHRCAFCGVRMLTVEGRTAVEAAHIIPWSLSHNDDVHNGIALCRLCHWTFDEGLAGISKKYLVVLSQEMRISQNLPGVFLTLEGRSILGPQERDLWPDVGALGWHRENVFRGG